jgi:hypothetical protein
MSDERKRCHEEQEHSSAILGVAVNLAGDPHQPQQTGRLQKADKGCRLRTLHAKMFLLRTQAPKHITKNIEVFLTQAGSTFCVPYRPGVEMAFQNKPYSPLQQKCPEKWPAHISRKLFPMEAREFVRVLLLGAIVMASQSNGNSFLKMEHS